MLPFPHRVKYINRTGQKPERIFAYDVRTRQLIDVTPVPKPRPKEKPRRK